MDLIKKRDAFSKQIVNQLRKKILDLSYIDNLKDSLCIYATGSFARGEASEHSDVDIFFIGRKDNKIKNLDEIILKADLIKIIRELNLPDFSGDGEYLTIHHLEDIIEKLGSPSDDYYNYFTARLLLLLESKPLFNDELYDIAISNIIDVYYNDYPDHKETFSPIFLANDIMRFWKTMCLNYEQKRVKNDITDTFKKNKARLKNLKLKFSRLTTCYSLLCCLKKGDQTTPSDLKNLIQLTPIERLSYISKADSKSTTIIANMLEIYRWFLDITDNETKDNIQWISDAKNQTIVNENAVKYHDLFYNLIELTSKDLLKFYTI
ncbi:nucleotidyltransferase domain-containing protein [Mucilaginibacter sp. UR6-1]|uniref:nucleotidyltransferase domain-containing protein n=1 Tax=Mucilaginibacter sp. UR6-1 TaxID=1435643 RepID=UPI001E3EFD75|nr:nucleotidyltransferase domain-containing protein [Mucilaginibacter sp. UR6-1]MCC8408719.1 nucleotidyltransferase domain-containing protein [Mucilaginibacter sp. UR6-1]